MKITVPQITRHWRRHGLQWALVVLELDARRKRGLIRVYGRKAGLARFEEDECAAEARHRIRRIHGVLRTIGGADWLRICAFSVQLAEEGIIEE